MCTCFLLVLPSIVLLFVYLHNHCYQMNCCLAYIANFHWVFKNELLIFITNYSLLMINCIHRKCHLPVQRLTITLWICRVYCICHRSWRSVILHFPENVKFSKSSLENLCPFRSFSCVYLNKICSYLISFLAVDCCDDIRLHPYPLLPDELLPQFEFSLSSKNISKIKRWISKYFWIWIYERAKRQLMAALWQSHTNLREWNSIAWFDSYYKPKKVANLFIRWELLCGRGVSAAFPVDVGGVLSAIFLWKKIQ